MEKNMDIKIKRLQNSNGLDIPSYATSNSAGIDLQAAISEDIIIVDKP